MADTPLSAADAHIQANQAMERRAAVVRRVFPEPIVELPPLPPPAPPLPPPPPAPIVQQLPYNNHIVRHGFCGYPSDLDDAAELPLRLDAETLRRLALNDFSTLTDDILEGEAYPLPMGVSHRTKAISKTPRTLRSPNGADKVRINSALRCRPARA